MASNPAQHRDAVGQRYGLDGWAVLEAQGRDAAGFLQRQSMNDVAALNGEHPCHWNGLLSAKGRVQALFLCLRLGDERFLLISPDQTAEELRQLLQRFVLRSKLALLPRDDLQVSGSWDEPGASAVEGLSVRVAGDADSSWAIRFPGESVNRALHIGDSSGAAVHSATAKAQWRLEDLRCGLPRLSADQFDAWTPDMLALDRLAAFSLKKGCYPGQEIVARTHYLGRSKRRLRRFDSAQPVPDGSAVIDADGNPLGNTICNASAGAESTTLLVCPIGLQDGAAARAADFALQAMPFAAEWQQH
jgi:folate-binding protein YgfZ